MHAGFPVLASEYGVMKNPVQISLASLLGYDAEEHRWLAENPMDDDWRREVDRLESLRVFVTKQWKNWKRFEKKYPESFAVADLPECYWTGPVPR